MNNIFLYENIAILFPVISKSELVQLMTWHLLGPKPLPISMLTLMSGIVSLGYNNHLM